MKKSTRLLLVLLCSVGLIRVSIYGIERYAIQKAIREIPAGRVVEWEGFGGGWLARYVFWRAGMKWDTHLICSGVERSRTEADAEDALIYLGQNNRVDSIPWLRSYQTENRRIKALSDVVRIGLEIGINSKNTAVHNGPDPQYVENYIKPAMEILAHKPDDSELAIRSKFPIHR